MISKMTLQRNKVEAEVGVRWKTLMRLQGFAPHWRLGAKHTLLVEEERPVAQRNSPIAGRMLAIVL